MLFVSSVLAAPGNAQEAGGRRVEARGSAHEHSAETAEAEPPEYRALIGQALEEYDAHNFEEARALFLRAHGLLPSARTLRGLGMAEFELRNYVDSIARLREALAATEKRLSGELRTQTVQLLARARTYVAELLVETVPHVREDVRISIDSEPTGRLPGQSVAVDVGEHVLLVQAKGYFDEQRSLSLKGAEQKRVLLELRPRPAEQGTMAARTDSESGERPRPLRKNPWLWSGVAAVVVGAVVAGVLLSRPNDKQEPKPIPGDIGDVVSTLGAR